MDNQDKANENTSNPAKVIKSRYDHVDNPEQLEPMPIVDPEGLIGCSFLMNNQEDGQKFRARVVEAINSHDNKVKNNPDLLRFRCSINNDQYEEILAYNDIVHNLYLDQESDNLWKFKEILSHEGPLSQGHKNYKGSKYNLMIKWENNEVTSEPLIQFGKDDPVSCAQYTLNNDLLSKEG